LPETDARKEADPHRVWRKLARSDGYEQERDADPGNPGGQQIDTTALGLDEELQVRHCSRVLA